MAFRLSEGTREMKRSLYGSRPAAYNIYIYNRYELINNVETTRGIVLMHQWLWMPSIPQHLSVTSVTYVHRQMMSTVTIS